MPVSSQNNLTKAIWTACIAVTISLTAVLPSFASAGNVEDAQRGVNEARPLVDDGTPPSDRPDIDAPVQTAVKDDGTLPQDFSQIEPLGLISESEGGFGEDVWLGTDRDRALDLMSQAPSITYYPMVQDMLRRLYLTRAKPEYFSRNHAPEAGGDYLTLRLQRLNDMGLFEYSTKLYSLITDVPYHEKLARAGVLAMMEGGKASLGCLETRTVLDRFGQLEFWQTLDAICDLRESGARSAGRAIEGNDIDLTGSASPVIARIAADPSYIFAPASQQDIDRLAPLERAALQASGSLSFARYRFDPQQPVSPVAFGMMLGDAKLDETRKFVTLVQSVAFGLRPASDVQLRYDLVKNDTTHKPEGWRLLAALYAKAGLLDAGPQQNTVIRQAMAMGHHYGGTYALTPYAGILASADPGGFHDSEVTDAVRIMIAGGVAVPTAWLQRLVDSTRNESDLDLFLAAAVDSDLSTVLTINNSHLDGLFANLSNAKKTMLGVLFSELDQGNHLKAWMAPDIYEKFMYLTAHLDYGMDNGRLASDLLQAYKDKKLGESIVLTAIALRDVQPADLDPKLAGTIIGGMKTVGLTKEARLIAAGVIMGSGF